VAWKDSGGAERAEAAGEIEATGESFACTQRGCGREAEPGSAVLCFDCGKTYRRCQKHGGLMGARRSLHSHRALYHPKGETR